MELMKNLNFVCISKNPLRNVLIPTKVQIRRKCVEWTNGTAPKFALGTLAVLIYTDSLLSIFAPLWIC